MTDWDCPTDDNDASGLAFIGLVCALFTIICLPFDLYARLRERNGAEGDDGGECADWGAEHLHNETGQ